MTETWRRVDGFPDYEVSDAGRVRSFRVDPSGRLMSPGKSKSGHLVVALWRDSPNSLYVHRLVAKAFLPNPEGHPLVLHWDDDPENNRVENLRWGTRVDNSTDAIRNGRIGGLSTCPYGHEKAGANLTAHGRCRACRLARYQAVRAGGLFDATRADQIYKELVP